MRDKFELRRVEKRVGTRKWVKTRMKDLAIGDCYRMFESDGKRVRDGRYSVFVVLSEPTSRRQRFSNGRRTVWGVESHPEALAGGLFQELLDNS